MDPNLWGPPLWKFLHLVSIHYPIKPSKKDKEEHKKFLHSLKHILPCPICANHYSEYMSDSKIENALQNKENYIKLIWSLHNDVNKRTQSKMYTFEEFIKLYTNLNNESEEATDINKKSINNFYSLTYNIMIFMLIFVILLMVYKLLIKKIK